MCVCTHGTPPPGNMHAHAPTLASVGFLLMANQGSAKAGNLLLAPHKWLVLVVQAEVEVYLLGEVVVLVVGHSGGDVVYDLGGGGGIVRRGLPSAAVPLQAPHEAAVSSEVHLRVKNVDRQKESGTMRGWDFSSSQNEIVQVQTFYTVEGTKLFF